MPKKKQQTIPSTKPASEQAPTSGGLQPRRLDPATIAAAAAAASKRTTYAKTAFMKLSAGTTTLRVFPGDPLFLSYRQNTTKAGGKFVSSMDFRSLFDEGGQPTLLGAAALEANRITEADLEKFQQYGDPFVTTMQALSQAGVKDADIPGGAFWPSMKYSLNVIDRSDQTIKLWETGPKAFDAIFGLLGKINEETQEFEAGEYPDLFDPEAGFDIIITGNGKNGPARRYESFVPARKASPLGQYEGEPYDLLDKALRLVRPFSFREQQLFASKALILAEYGVTPNMFGGFSATTVGDGDASE